MTETKDYEYLLDLENVNGVDYDEGSDVVTVLVTGKVSEDELEEDQIVSNNVEIESDVVELGEIEVHEMADAQGDRHSKHRPVLAGVSEINANSTAATAGHYPVEVVDTSKGEWSDSIEEGDVVRLSNNHVYARVNQANFGEPIIQPSPFDGGSSEEKVGELAGYVMIEDGCLVDAAVRTTGDVEESKGYHNMTEDNPTGKYEGSWSDIKGKTLSKTGRTTGVTEADVKATSASIRVNYGEDGVITLRDQIVAGDMSEGGDSGSSVILKESGEVIGLLFAGSDRSTIINKISNVEKELGVKVMTDGDSKFRRMFDIELSVPMEHPSFEVVELLAHEPLPGETVDATAVVKSGYVGKYWVYVQDERYVFELDESDENGNGEYEKELTVDVTAPDEYSDEFNISVEGGYVE